MKTALPLLALASAAAALPHACIDANERALFAAFKETFGRRYTSPEDEAARRAAFKANLRKGADMEARNPRATFRVDRFSDMTADEFKVYHSLDR